MDTLQLLKDLIRIPSFSREEKEACDFWRPGCGTRDSRCSGRATISVESSVPDDRPTILLNAPSTPSACAGYTRDPFTPVEEDGKLYGLGSNDDGGSLVACWKPMSGSRSIRNPTGSSLRLRRRRRSAARRHRIHPARSGEGGFRRDRRADGHEYGCGGKGLMVLDCTVRGKSGHAARDEGVNAIYKALGPIEWFRDYTFPKISPFLGPVKMSVTQVHAGTQHNVIPDVCTLWWMSARTGCTPMSSFWKSSSIPWSAKSGSGPPASAVLRCRWIIRRAQRLVVGLTRSDHRRRATRRWFPSRR